MKQEIYLTTDAVIFCKQKNNYYILLIQRKNDPFKNKWALPGGFVNQDEKLIHACQRELQEETGLNLIPQQLKFVGVFDDINRDPRCRTISIAYTSLVDELFEVKGMDDAAKAEWINLEEPNQLAFDHNTIVVKAKETLHL